MPWPVVVAAAVLGLLVGSFLNVVIARVPARQSVVRPGSRCPACAAPVAPRDNIPVVSYLVLRARCRSCGAAIPVRYPLVEAGTAVLFALLATHFHSWVLPAFLLFAAALVAIALIDLEHYIVPNRILVPVVAGSVPLLAVGALDGGRWHSFGRALLGGAAAFAVLLAVNLISPRGMGMGDVKLAFLLGLYLGWLGWGEVVLGLFLGFFLGAVIGVVLLVTRRRGRRDHLPFAPFLAAGALLAVLWGEPLLRWYTGGG